MNIVVDDKGCVEFVVDKNGHSELLCLAEPAILRLIELGCEEAVEAQKTRQHLIDNLHVEPRDYLIKISRFNPLLVQVVRELGQQDPKTKRYTPDLDKHLARNTAAPYCSDLAVIKVKLEYFLLRLMEYPGSCNILKQAYDKHGKKEDHFL
jgi:hypothetical protein